MSETAVQAAREAVRQAWTDYGRMEGTWAAADAALDVLVAAVKVEALRSMWDVMNSAIVAIPYRSTYKDLCAAAEAELAAVRKRLEGVT